MLAIDTILNASAPGPQAATDPTDQAEHAAAPQSFNFSTNAKTIALAILGLYVLIYIIHIFERWMNKA